MEGDLVEKGWSRTQAFHGQARFVCVSYTLGSVHEIKGGFHGGKRAHKRCFLGREPFY